MAESKCPECETKNYLVWPSYGNCQICLKLRHENLDKAFAGLDALGRGALHYAA